MLYVSLGILMDVLVTLHVRFIASHQATLAALMSVILTCISYKIMGQYVVTQDDYLLYSYAIGCGLGTYTGVKVRRWKGLDKLIKRLRRSNQR